MYTGAAGSGSRLGFGETGDDDLMVVAKAACAEGEDVWYPLMRERILLAIQTYAPDLVRAQMMIGK